MPLDIDCYCMAIRALWVKYDHYSDSSSSYIMPKLTEEYESLYTIGTNYHLFMNFILYYFKINVPLYTASPK